MERKTIVISAVNIRKGGTLTILRNCLQEASSLCGEWRVVALVHSRSLCDYPGIEYIEMPATIKRWTRRLWAEYVTMRTISKQIGPVYLWLSLHDTTPNVVADRQAVYCQTSFPFMKAKWQDLKFDPKIAIFSALTKFVYKINVHRNKFLIVQTQWLRRGLSKMLNYPEDQMIVARPQAGGLELPNLPKGETPTFLYVATPDCHKNFETLFEATRILEKELSFKVVVTIDGSENKYSAWLRSKYGDVKSIDFHGLVKKDELARLYASATCLVFPSRVETWGLPISEFAPTGKPIIISDLPYGHETAAGLSHVVFFDPESPHELAERMKDVIDGKAFSRVPNVEIAEPSAASWKELFELLLK